MTKPNIIFNIILSSDVLSTVLQDLKLSSCAEWVFKPCIYMCKDYH